MNNPVPASPSPGKSAAKKTAAKPFLHGTTTDAQRLGMVILEVLAGNCTPAEAATRLGVSLPRYYQLETRAVEGLVRGCEPKPLGKQPSPDTRLHVLQKQLQQAQRECARQQALVRVTQRSVGVALPAKPAPAKSSAKPARSGRQKRRPTVRALKAVAVLQQQVGAEPHATVQPEQAEPSAVVPSALGTPT